ncbi:hypothetical protein MmiEs2_08500 [Methanimicrococcus stummii]|uniref:DUF8061 domain-containing protein n=1 Tax=Methanimicrococcus stummii TaxID=3028294 RepID=A0AA96VAE1_9EURY|nr:hypothetical protein [Methanimicrococcus sp. Es2]WNY28650.1 hypothetical protein MmiEs2_08500 [Methanimicrococcus sp. Es2]
MNELEFSDTNAEELKNRGYSLINDESNTVLGSAEIAKHAFDAGCAAHCGGAGDNSGDCACVNDGSAGDTASGAKMNFCSSRYKDAIQLRLRLLRTARQFARPFDEITEDGTIYFGRVKAPDSDSLSELIRILQENELPEEAYAISGNVIETAAGIVEELKAIFEEDEDGFEKVQLWIIEQYPFVGGFVVGSERIF